MACDPNFFLVTWWRILNKYYDNLTVLLFSFIKRRINRKQIDNVNAKINLDNNQKANNSFPGRCQFVFVL